MTTEKTVITFSLAGLATIFHAAAPFFIAACVFMLLDFGTGFIKAMMTHTVNSGAVGKGIWKKLSYLVGMTTGWALDFTVQGLLESAAGFTLPFDLPIGVIISCWVILTETISIFENLAECGAPVPNFVVKFFKQKKEEIEQSDGDKD